VLARVAVVSDVHGNATALQAVVDDLRADGANLVVFGGDLTWGPEPEETLAIVEELDVPAVFVRGNAERALIESWAARQRGEAIDLSPREAWLLERPPDDELGAVAWILLLPVLTAVILLLTE
jgi:predicted phosphodiesterase